MHQSIRVFAIVAAAIFGYNNRAAAQLPIIPPADPPQQMVLGASPNGQDSASEATVKRELSELLPVIDESSAVNFWNQTSTRALTGGAVFMEDDVIGANVELVSDVIGVLRVGFGMTASGQREDDVAVEQENEPANKEEALANLVQSGGTAYLNAAWPVFATKPARANSAALLLLGRAAWEASKTSSTDEESGVAGSLGFDLQYRRMGAGKLLNFEAGLFANTYLLNDAFASMAGTDETVAALAGARVALVIGSKTRIGLSYRPFRTATFDDLRRTAIYIQQVNTP
jgi:hypothetical protein